MLPHEAHFLGYAWLICMNTLKDQIQHNTLMMETGKQMSKEYFLNHSINEVSLVW